MKCYFLVSMVFILAVYGYSQVDLNKNDVLPEKTSEKLVVGEDLTYVVKYAFFNLGEVRFKVLEKTKIYNKTVYKTVAYIDSYPDLPIVSLHQIYESYIDSTLFPLKFFAKIFRDDTVFVEYNFTEVSKVEMKKAKYGSSKLLIDSTAYTKHRLQDGLSILFFARMNIGEHRTDSVRCFVNEKEEITVLNFYSEREPVSIDAVKYEVDCVRLDGRTDFVSVYGLTGDFEGWFSNDSFSVPIRATMNVIIGSVNLELIKWNEKLWNPPLYKN
ncbi:MAG: DUF3108 domain-containing protein [Ignavibacteriaceae bacterium]|nr:DUF3108 domain-containing protein [Ignavibacteriaceae bacterium]